MITLEIAQAKLALWLEAESAIATSQSYEIEVDGSRRKLTRADLGLVAKRLEYWNGVCAKLTSQAAGRRRTRTIVN